LVRREGGERPTITRDRQHLNEAEEGFELPLNAGAPLGKGTRDHGFDLSPHAIDRRIVVGDDHLRDREQYRLNVREVHA
jgi:hypothetical protein